MARFILFFVFILGVVYIFSFKNLNLEINNKKFDYKKTSSSYQLKQKEIMHAMGLNDHNHQNLKIESNKKHLKVSTKSKVFVVSLTTEELKAGHSLFKKCAICHGKDGWGKSSQKAPNIAGQYNWYIEKQLKDMKSKVRINKKMDPFVRKLSNDDIKNLALYISKLHWKK